MGTNVPGVPFSWRKASGFLVAPLMIGLLPALATAADTPSTTDDSNGTLQEIVVTGSLIPQSKVELATPVSVITSQDIQAKGFADIAEALQRSIFATGPTEGGQYTGGFTAAAKTFSFFGLNPSYTKFLIDGRPISDYPALYNGTDTIVSVTGIPTALVDHIDTLPGAQSTIYGSDAIAGVVNVVMKKNFDGPIVDARYGWTADGGGNDRRISLGDGFALGNINVVVGGQYENLSPIWGYQRPLTNEFYSQGSTPQTAERDYVVIDESAGTYLFEDPANCANVTAGFGGTEALRNRANRGEYCGTDRTGFYTIQNGDEQTQGYLHASYDINEHAQVFVETLLNHDVSRFNNGQLFYGSDVDSNSPYYFYEDPTLAPGDYLNVQHIFSPEESGGLGTNTDKDTNNSVRGTFGVSGELWAPSWRYLADFTYTVNRLTESIKTLSAPPVEAFFGSNFFGPTLGFDNNLGVYEFSPNYANFYKPITPAEYGSFLDDLISRSQTEESFARAQITSTDLFPLPGGSAGMALQAEAGDQGWFYHPDPAYSVPGISTGTAFGYTSVGGAGHRSREAGSAEVKLPVLPMVTLNASGRYDDYKLTDSSVDKWTYNLGFEFRPLQQFLLRGRWGSAFKAPTLSDQFQGISGSFTGVTDYYTCAKQGFSGATIGNCPEFGGSTFVTTQGNTQLKPITAKEWDLGFIATPVNRLTFTADFIHWSIYNEVAEESADLLSQTDASCLEGNLPAASPACVNAEAQVVRNAGGEIVSISAPKENVAAENLGVVVMELDYKFYAGGIGQFEVDAGFSDMMSHNQQQFPGGPITNLLWNPGDELIGLPQFKTKDNLSITWTLEPVSATIYVERYGETANYLTYASANQYATPGAGNVSPWTLANASVSWRPIHSLGVTFAVNNLFNTGPPQDHTQPGAYPTAYGNQPFNEFDYNNYGRSYYITVHYAFDSK
jgi:outer membrane receptor protein involved in Fe transport